MSVDLGKKTGTVSLQKGQQVSLDKGNGVITAKVSFSSRTDYDVYAVALYTDGTQKVCSTFGSQEQPDATDRIPGVYHEGDVQRGGDSSINEETLMINLIAEIAEVAVVCYSAQSNGTGSFRRYKVSMEVSNSQGDKVLISADDASDNDRIYTCVPAIIYNDPSGVRIEQVEMYSRMNSEDRPAYVSSGVLKKVLTLKMDAGSKNAYK